MISRCEQTGPDFSRYSHKAQKACRCQPNSILRSNVLGSVAKLSHNFSAQLAARAPTTPMPSWARLERRRRKAITWCYRPHHQLRWNRLSRPGARRSGINCIPRTAGNTPCALLQRAQAAGCTSVCLTIDLARRTQYGNQRQYWRAKILATVTPAMPGKTSPCSTAWTCAALNIPMLAMTWSGHRADERSYEHEHCH